MTQALAESSAQANQARAQGLIDKLSSPVLPHFIAGEAQPGIEGRTFQNFSPLDGKTLNQTALGTAADVRRASAAAAAAFESWRSWSGAQRRDLLHTIADRIDNSLGLRSHVARIVGRVLCPWRTRGWRFTMPELAA